MEAKRQLKINIPNDVKWWLEERAASNMRSQSAEIVMLLRQQMDQKSETKKADAPA